MSDSEALGRALAARAGSTADLAPAELQAFGAWLLDVMSRLILVQDDRAVDLDLRRLAREAFYARRLPVPDQQRLGKWVEADLDNLRRRDRRTSGSVRMPGGRRASDREGYSPIRAAHLKEVDDYFGIARALTDVGCTHGYRPARSCPDEACKGRRAQIAWDALG